MGLIEINIAKHYLFVSVIRSSSFEVRFKIYTRFAELSPEINNNTGVTRNNQLQMCLTGNVDNLTTRYLAF